MKDDRSHMSLIGHLAELRRRIIIMVLYIVPSAIAVYGFSDRLRFVFTRLAVNLKLVYLSPSEALATNVKIAFLTAIVLTSPATIYQAWAFISPGLRHDERSIAWKVVLCATVLFFSGIAFAYFAVLPFVLRFMLGFADVNLQATFSYSRFIDFASSILLSFGLIFQLPVVVLLLVSLGLATPGFLRANRKYAVLVVFVVAAILTPPDVLSQLLMAGPLVALYELSVLVSNYAYRRRTARDWSKK